MHRLLPLLVLGLLAPVPRLAGAAAIDAATSSVGASEVLDLSGPGEFAFALTLRAADPIVLDVAVDAAEKGAPLVLEAQINNLTGRSIDGLTLGVAGSGVSFAQTGAVAADAAPSTQGVTAAANAVQIDVDASRIVYFVELADTPDGAASWRIDVGSLPDAEKFHLSLSVAVPEPGAASTLLTALGALLALALRRKRTRAGVSVLALGVLLGGAEPARAATHIVTNSVDGSFGSLRNALDTFASAGDTITFQAAEVVLDGALEVPAKLTGLTIQGPVTIRPVAGQRGNLQILADAVTISGGVVFQDTHVLTAFTGSLTGVTISGNRFQGDATLTMLEDHSCSVVANVFAVQPKDALAVAIHLSRTRDCIVSNNEIASPLWTDIADFNSENLEIRSNKPLSGGIFSYQRSGRIADNQARFVYVVPNEGLPSGPLLVTENDVEFMRVHRTNVEVVTNRVDASAGARGRADVAIALTNDDPRGGAGTFSARDNRTTSGRVGILYADADGDRVPGELLDNKISTCRSQGLRASGPQGTLIRDNRITGCGQGGSSSGLSIARARTAEVVAENNTVLSTVGDGIVVSDPTAAVTLRANTVQSSTRAGIVVQGATGPPVAIEGGLLSNNTDHGLWVLAGSRARVLGTEIRNNGKAGALLFDDTRVEISQVSMSKNGEPGIDLVPAGVTPNAETKTANADIDWPEYLRLDVPAQKIEGSALPGARVEAYLVEADPRAGNPQNGEGQVYLGAVTADASGNFAFPAAGAVDCPAAMKLTFTATAAVIPAFTSEFSPDFDCDVPALDTDGDSVTDDLDQCPDTPEGTLVDANGCPIDLDEDDDGVLDEADVCRGTPAGTPVEPNGCAENIALDDGRSASCNDPATCLVTPSGGPCQDCIIESATGDVHFDCLDEPEDSTCSAVSDGSFACTDCDAAVDDASLDCRDADCRFDPDTELLVCEGGPGSCAATFSSGTVASCPIDRSCAEVIRKGTGSGEQASVTIEKETLGGDGAFVFGFQESGLLAGPRVELAGIATNAGLGTRVITILVDIPDAFDIFGLDEVTQQGWDLESVVCDVGSVFDEAKNQVIVTLMPDQHATCTFMNRRLGPDTVRSDTGVTLPEAAERAGTFGLPPGNRITIAGSNGFVIVDALTGLIPTAGVRRLSFLEPPFGASTGVLTLANPDGDDRDAFFAYGPGGSALTHYDPIAGNFGGSGLDFGNITDAHHVGSNPSATALYVDFQNRGLWGLFFAADPFEPPGSPKFVNAAQLAHSFSFTQVTPARPISAYGVPFGTHALVAADGQPGKLLAVQPGEFGNALVTVQGDLQNDPRRVRCAAGVCAVSNFGSDSLTIVLWNGGATASITGNVAVGDGPVGISLRPFGANVLIASTGFGDDTFWLTQIAPDGSVVSNDSFPAPVGCSTPGHALWLRDAEESLVLTCRGSDAYAVITPGPTPP